MGSAELPVFHKFVTERSDKAVYYHVFRLWLSKCHTTAQLRRVFLNSPHKFVFRQSLKMAGLLAAFCAVSLAQTTSGDLVGTVYDGSGATVPNATVIAANAATAKSVTETTS